MPEVKDVWVCGDGCGHRSLEKPDEHESRNGWFCCEKHSEKCDLHMCQETEKWLSGLS